MFRRVNFMYKNLEKFVEWLKKVSKAEVTETYIKETLKELDDQYCNTGMEEFELSKFQTKSGNPETISYNIEHEEDDKGNITIICEF